MAYRRLAYHRSWFLIVLGALGLVGVIYATIELYLSASSVGMGDAALIPVILGPLALLLIARGITGSWSKQQLRVDVPAGMLMLADGSVHKLDELGELTIEKRSAGKVRVHLMFWYRLRAATVDSVLFESLDERESQVRLDALDAAVLQNRVRRVLERPEAEGAFRAGPDPLAEVMRIAATGDRANAALARLARDADAGIRDRALKLASQLRSS